MPTDYVYKDENQISVLRLVVTLVVFVAATFYVIMAFSNNDPLWFLPRFTDRPREIRIYHEGATTVLTPSDPGYDTIVDTFNAQMGSPNRFLPDFGMSEESERDARELHTSVEFIYSQPVRLHTNISLGRPSSFLVPITGRHSERLSVFLGYGDELGYLPGAFLLNDRSALDAALRQQGFLP